MLLLGVVVVLVVARPGGEDADAPLTGQRADLLAYSAALDPLTRQGGQVVQEGLKQLATDLHMGNVPDEELASAARSLLRAIERVRDDVLALRAPAFAETTKGLYDHAMRDYAAVARVLVAATDARGDDRAVLLDLAIDMGEETDDLYDRAERAMDRARARLGLPSEEDRP